MNKKVRTLLLTLLFVFTVAIAGKVLADALNNTSNEGKITVNKTATTDKDDNRKANITLSIGGNQFTKTKTLDVVLVIDRSTSMNDPVNESDSQTRMEATKKAANSLVTKLLRNNTAEKTVVQMGIVTFGSEVIDSYRHYTSNYNYTNLTVTSSNLSANEATIKSYINNIPNHIGDYEDDMDQQGTNVQSGLERAGELLASSTANEKIIILLSDGQPNLFNYNGDIYGNGQDDTEDCIDYDCIIGIICSCDRYMTPSEAAKNEATELKTATETKKAITIYTVGYGLGEDTTTKQFLVDVATSSQHAYVADKTSELEGKFNDIVKDITTIASSVSVEDIIPAEFNLDEAAIKKTYGDVVGPITNEDGSTTTTYKKIASVVENEDGTTTNIYSDEISITHNTNGTTKITWIIGDLQSVKDEALNYSVIAKEDYYGGMYTNVSAVLTGKTTDNPAYPSGSITETFPVPIAAIAMNTKEDSYSAKLGETLIVNDTNGILKNDSINKKTEGEGTNVTNEIVIKSVSCGNIKDITVNNDGSFSYTPDSACYASESSNVTFEYVVKSTVTINGTPKVVTSNPSPITINITKDDSSIENPTVTKINNNGNTTTNITGPFNYTIKYNATIENHIGSTIVTIVDTLPYQLDETKTNDLVGGTYNASDKTITWIETIEGIDTYNNQKNNINIEKTIEVFYKDVPTDVEKIENNASVKTDIDNIPVEGKQETTVVRGTVIVEYIDNLGNTLSDSTSTKGLIDSEYKTTANNIITVDNTEYQLVATKVNGIEVEKTNNYKGKYTETTTTVTYVYYKVTGNIDEEQTVFTKEGPEKVTTSDGEFEYTITYNSKIDNYIGNATVTIVDTLPYQLDETKANDLAGGTYNATNKTITWIETIKDINTYKNGTYSVEIEKTIKVVFKNINANERTLINNVNIKLETSKSSQEKDANEQTELAINGYVVAHYIDINNKTIAEDFNDSDLVGNDYVTTAKNINGYKLVETRGTPNGKYIDGTIEVTYVYYELKGNITGDSFTKTGTEEVTSTDESFEYTITYNATINDYIGDATITIVDTLPLPLDETKVNDLAGGIYNESDKTITWVETIEDIDTNANGAKTITITKKIKVTYKGLEATTRTISNSVTGTIKTSVAEKTTDPDEAETSVKVSGQVIAHYVDTEGKTLFEDVKTTGLVGDKYATTAKEIAGYKLVEIRGNSEGAYTVESIEVTYVYYRVEGNINDNTLTKTGTDEVTSTNANFEYEIKYSTTIKNYIGDATITIVDALPLPLDETKVNDLAGGTYNESDKTLTWVETIKDIDTNTNGDKTITITKKINITYEGLEATARKISNSVVATIKTDVKEETTDPVVKETLVNVKGEVITHYVDTEGNAISDDVKIIGLVGDSYVTSAKNIPNHQLVKTIGNKTGEHTLETIEVTYVYYKETGEVAGDVVTKKATEEVASTDANFEYEIKYSTTIKNYIGDATVTIVDTLPLPLDETKVNDLAGGTYNASDKTITWVETIKDIDTNTNGNKVIEITKKIKVTYKGLEATTRKISNSVVATIKTDISEKTTEPAEAQTAVKVSGEVITHYVDTKGNTISKDTKTTGLVGNEYVTTAQEITGYQLVKTNGNTKGAYAVETIEVTYIYYKETSDITNNIVEKTGNKEILIKDEKVSYTINYKTNIDNYIGNATVTIVDYLPHTIDLTASELAGGIYDEETATITWVITINNIDTYTNGTYKFELTKEILLTYKDLDLTADTITNNVAVTVKTDKSEKTAEDGFETDVNVKGNVIVNYVDDQGNEIGESITLTGKIGTTYETDAKDFTDYVLVAAEGKTKGEYVEGELVVTYVYTPVGKGGDVEELPPQTGIKENMLLLEFISTLIITLFLVVRKNI